MTYRFIGSFTRVLGSDPLTLKKYGQQFDLPDDRVADIKHQRGIPAIPEVAFLEIFPEGKVDPKDPNLATKKAEALAVLRALREVK